MDYQEALDYIHSHKRFRAKPGLERMRELLAFLGNPQEQLSCVHIAGTNGKGSTVAMIASVLRAAGYKTGMYISPYVLEYRERIQVNGEMIPQDALVRLVERIQPFAEQAGELTEFELNTALAFCWFAEQGCGIVVLETGLGGRFDATNVIQHPLLCVHGQRLPLCTSCRKKDFPKQRKRPHSGSVWNRFASRCGSRRSVPTR